jgi:hypothetical protein
LLLGGFLLFNLGGLTLYFTGTSQRSVNLSHVLELAG